MPSLGTQSSVEETMFSHLCASPSSICSWLSLSNVLSSAFSTMTRFSNGGKDPNFAGPPNAVVCSLCVSAAENTQQGGGDTVTASIQAASRTSRRQPLKTCQEKKRRNVDNGRTSTIPLVVRFKLGGLSSSTNVHEDPSLAELRNSGPASRLLSDPRVSWTLETRLRRRTVALGAGTSGRPGRPQQRDAENRHPRRACTPRC